jgi:glycosyltransferase involved in cell wall biosynthesis
MFWIPDLQHRFWPSFFSTEEVVCRDRDMTALALRAVPIVFSSHTAQQHFDEHFPTQQCRTYVWHFVSQPDMANLQAPERYRASKLPERFYYTPNQFWRHKNHVTLFHALRRILDSGHNMTFVCTGSDLHTATDEYSRELLALVASLSLGQNLRLLGVLPRADQIEVMRYCCAVIQPSLFEGWSTVVEDARAIGRPIIASDIPVHREQLGENAAFFAPGSAESLAAAVISLDLKLKPGPAPDQEAAALRDLKSRMQRSAQDFLAILGREGVLRP